MQNLDRDHRFQMGEIERQADISVRGVPEKPGPACCCPDAGDVAGCGKL